MGNRHDRGDDSGEEVVEEEGEGVEEEEEQRLLLRKRSCHASISTSFGLGPSMIRAGSCGLRSRRTNERLRAFLFFPYHPLAECLRGKRSSLQGGGCGFVPKEAFLW